MQLHNRSEQILRPARPTFVWLSLLLAMVCNFLPTRQWPGMPDWVLLVLCIWAIREPLLVGMGWAFALGFLMDVADAAVLGQHSFAYILAVFGAGMISRRVIWFPLTQQGLHALPLLLLAPFVQALIRHFAGGDWPHWSYWLSPLISVLLWMPITILLLLPQLQPHERDETRPI